MMTGWNRVRLEDLVKVEHGFAFLGEYFSDEPTSRVLVTPGNFEIGGGFKLDRPKFYADDGPVRPEYVLAPGTLVVTMTDLSKKVDTLGFGAVIPASTGYTFLHNQRVGRVVLEDDSTSTLDFIHWVLRSPSYRHHVIGTATGTSVKHTAPTRITSYSFDLPPIDEQRRIAGVLDALDKKALHNRVLARRLDELADAFFARSFEQAPDSECDLGSVATVLLGGTPSRSRADYWDGDIAWINSGKANEFRIIAPSEWITETGLQKSATKLLPAGTTIVAITGATMGKVSRLELDACANQSIVGILGTEKYPDDFLYFWMRRQVYELLKKQTGAAQQHVNKGDISSLHLPDVSASDVDEYLEKVSPLMQLIKRLLEEARSLEALRDALLPRLVSGQLRVDEGFVPFTFTGEPQAASRAA